MEVGTANIDGSSGGIGAVVYGSGSVLGVEGELNASDGNQINVNDAVFETVSGGGASEVGPLAVSNGGDLYVGDPGPGYTGGCPVRRGTLRRRSRCDGYTVRAMGVSLVVAGTMV
jgi:hypothetical protein